MINFDDFEPDYYQRAKWNVEINGKKYVNIEHYCKKYGIKRKEFNEKVTFRKDPRIVNISDFFRDCTSFNQPIHIPKNIELADALFINCKNFNSPVTIDDDSNLMHASIMFAKCSKFNQDVSKIINIITRNNNTKTPLYPNNYSGAYGKSSNYLAEFLRSCESFNNGNKPFVIKEVPKVSLFDCFHLMFNYSTKSFDIKNMNLNLKLINDFWFMFNGGINTIIKKVKKDFISLAGDTCIICSEKFSGLDIIKNRITLSRSDERSEEILKIIAEDDDSMINIGDFLSNNLVIDIPLDKYLMIEMYFNLKEK